ncbi:outer membrane beta-barrel family protein [Aquimarina algiphila]|uniref:outer membrane beta-barrel family protein n=1 Tax=Aquimarina algiphila TaxID=2047982 RepID=UPI001430F1F6|nr:outer membrane beta-barrel family protein [Aquimarina algiphila]
MARISTEITNINLESKRRDFVNQKRYSDLFPSAFFRYTINDHHKFQLSLSRRINRPRNWMIIPFSSFTDERNVFSGNPEIDPSYTNLSELNYNYKISKKLSINPTLYYRGTSDEMEFFVEKQTVTIDNETREVFVSTIANIGQYNAFGLEMGVSYKPFPWWNMYLEFTFNGFKQVGSFRGASFDGEGVLIYGRYNTTISFLDYFKLQVQNNYRGPIETGQYKRKGIYQMNAGLSIDLFNQRGLLTFNINDVFNSGVRKVTSFGSDFTRDLELQNRIRQINLSFSYIFNQNKNKGKKGNQYDNFKIIN